MIPYFLLLVTGTMQEKVYVIFDRWKNFLVIFLISLWRLSMLWGIKRGYEMEYCQIWWLRPLIWNMEKVLQVWLGLSQNPNQCRYGQIVIIWTLKRVNETLHSLAKLFEQNEKVITTHKEECQARVILEQNFRNLCQPVSTLLTHL